MLTCYQLIRWFFVLLLALSLTTVAYAQLNEHCVVSILNRTVQVRPDGSWVLPNIPANFGQIRARATCVENALTRSGQSDLFSIPTNGSVDVPRIQRGALNKLVANISLGRNTAGVHWRSDGIEGLKLGGAVAVGILRDLRATYPETSGRFSLTSFASATVTI